MKTLLIDFDGTLHSYASGWKGPRNIPDPPVYGAIQWLEGFLVQHCTLPDSISALTTSGEWEVCIFSSRAKYFGGVRAMRNWLVKHGLDKRFLEVIKFGKGKPAHQVILDDRAMTFDGTFPDYEKITSFKPWNKK